MVGRVRRFQLRSALDVIMMVIVIAAALTVIYRNMSSSPVPAELEVPSEPVSIEGAPLRGSEDAEVVMIVYADFQCPYCGRFTREVLPDIERHYVATGRVALAFRHLPLSIHPQAVPAAVRAECAGQQGKFWEMHDFLFAQEPLDEETLLTLPESIRVDRPRFADCLLDQTVGERVRASGNEARGLGIRGTPAFLIGTRLSDGRVDVTRTISGTQPVEVFEEQLDGALKGESAGWRSWIGRYSS